MSAKKELNKDSTKKANTSKQTSRTKASQKSLGEKNLKKTRGSQGGEMFGADDL